MRQGTFLSHRPLCSGRKAQGSDFFPSSRFLIIMTVQAPEHELIIIGGGISGLGLAYFSQRLNRRPLLLEASDRLGGCIHSTEIVPDFWIELAAHSVYNSYGHLLDMLSTSGQKTTAWVSKKSLPFLTHDGTRRQSVFAHLGWLELLMNLPRLAVARREDHSVAGYYSRVLGSRNYQRLFRHAFNAVLCQPASDFPAAALFRRKPRHREFPRKFSGQQGLSSLINAIAHQLPQGSIRQNAPVESLAREDQGFSLQLADGTRMTARQVALATPADVSSQLARAAFPELSQHLATIGASPVTSLGVAIAEADLNLPPLAGLIGLDQPYFSVVSRDPIPQAGIRGFTFHFRPDLSEAQQRACVCQTLGVAESAWLGCEFSHKTLPALRMGHARWVQHTEALLTNSGLGLTGNYFLGVSIEDCLHRSASEAARLAGVTP